MDFSKAKILCLGDLMLDRFAYCDIERISPEAPVPVLLLQRTQNMLGGAGNVARNVAALGATAILMGLLGSDAAGTAICRLIADTPRLLDGHGTSAQRPTICKTRYLAGHQQIVRVDEESVHPLDAAEMRGLLAAAERAIPGVDAVILSDYGKAALAPQIIEAVIEQARSLGVPVYVDPKSYDFGSYRGATCITPNQRELAQAARMPVARDTEIIAAGQKVMQDAAADAILVTRSEKGMALVERSGAVHFEAARAREVYDVSGAGDTVIAMLAVAATSGYALPQAMRLANSAAGIVVSKL